MHIHWHRNAKGIRCYLYGNSLENRTLLERILIIIPSCDCTILCWQTIEDRKQFTDEDLKAYKPRFDEIEAHEKFDVTPIPRAEPEFPKDHQPAPGQKPDEADLLYADNARDYV